MADIFDSYQLADAWDEMFEQPGRSRPAYHALLAALQPLDPAELRYRADQLASLSASSSCGSPEPVARRDPVRLTAWGRGGASWAWGGWAWLMVLLGLTAGLADSPTGLSPPG